MPLADVGVGGTVDTPTRIGCALVERQGKLPEESEIGLIRCSTTQRNVRFGSIIVVVDHLHVPIKNPLRVLNIRTILPGALPLSSFSAFSSDP